MFAYSIYQSTAMLFLLLKAGLTKPELKVSSSHNGMLISLRLGFIRCVASEFWENHLVFAKSKVESLLLSFCIWEEKPKFHYPPFNKKQSKKNVSCEYCRSSLISQGLHHGQICPFVFRGCRLRMRPTYFPTTTSSSPASDSSVPQAPPWFIISRK